MEKENKYGNGAIRDIPDIRDYKFSDIAGSIPSFDWNTGFDVENICKIIVKDQNGSSSCGGQAWSYYGQVLDPDHQEKSAKFIYAHTNAPGGGSAGRTNCDFVKKSGWGSENKTTSYENGNPPSEAFMVRKSDILEDAYKEALLDKALSYANVDINIDSIAKAVKENNGCIIGITGKNNGTWLTQFPQRPDKLDNTCWNHWVYIGKAKVINGKKYLGIINSWGENCGDKGWQWISEEYIEYPYVWSAWTLVYNFPVNYPTLKRGSKGEYVKELQTKLNKLGGSLIIDGNFGLKTHNEVIKFQKKYNLTSDGIVGKNTWYKINSLTNK